MDALPIVSLISLLVGLILAFVGVIQLKMFGAEIYVSSLVAGPYAERRCRVASVAFFGHDPKITFNLVGPGRAAVPRP